MSEIMFDLQKFWNYEDPQKGISQIQEFLGKKFRSVSKVKNNEKNKTESFWFFIHSLLKLTDQSAHRIFLIDSLCFGDSN